MTNQRKQWSLTGMTTKVIGLPTKSWITSYDLLDSPDTNWQSEDPLTLDELLLTSDYMPSLTTDLLNPPASIMSGKLWNSWTKQLQTTRRYHETLIKTLLELSCFSLETLHSLLKNMKILTNPFSACMLKRDIRNSLIEAK